MLVIKSNNIIRLTQISMLAAIAIILVAFVHIPIIPSASFLEYDMADIPILIGTLLFGTTSGIIILFISSAIQAFMLGGNGWIGFLMHFIASGVFVFIIGQIYKRRLSLRDAVVGMAIGTIIVTLLMIPLNYFFIVVFWGMPKEAVDAIILSAIVPFNLFKLICNSLISIILFRGIKPFIEKNKDKIGLI